MVPLCITLKIDDEDDDDEDEEDEDEDDDDDWRAQWACSRKNLFKPLWASTSAWQSIILSLNLRDDEDDEDDEDDDEDELHMSTSSFMAITSFCIKPACSRISASFNTARIVFNVAIKVVGETI